MEIAMQTLVDFIPSNLSNPVPSTYFIVHGVYLYGELEEEQGSEFCASSQNLLFVEEGIHEVSFNGKEGYLLYLWKQPSSTDISINQGFVCKSEDLSGCTYAKECFNRKNTEF